MKDERGNKKMGVCIVVRNELKITELSFLFLVRTVIEVYSFEFYIKSTSQNKNCRFSQNFSRHSETSH